MRLETVEGEALLIVEHGIVRDVTFSNPKQQEIFAHLSEAFGRQPLECLRSAAERIIAQKWPYDDEPVLCAARVVLDMDRRRAEVPPEKRTRIAWDALAEARACLMEPRS